MRTIIHGDCLEELKKLDDSSVDAVVTDPPYGLSNTKPTQVADVLAAWVTGETEAVPAKRGGFMGADWDSFVPPPAVWEECMRVLKPGGHMAVFAGARTQDLMGLSIRLAGFEIRDTLGWIYGSGFPKSMDISKAIDKRRDDYPAIREVVMFIREAVAASTVDRSRLDEALGGSAVMAHFLAPSRSNAGCPRWDQWQTLKSILNFGDDMDAEVWRLNGRKGTPGEAWEKREVVGKSPHKSGIGNSTRGHYTVGGTKAEAYNITAPATSEAQRWDGWGTALKPAIEPIILARKPLDGTVANNVLAHGVGGLNIDACRVGTTGGGNSCKGGDNCHCFEKNEIYGATKHPVQSDEPKGRFPANVLLDEHAAKEMDKQSGVSVSKAGGRSGTHFSAGNEGVPTPDRPRGGHNDSGGASRFFPVFKSEEETPETKGRFPANVLLDEHAAKEMDKQSGWSKSPESTGRGAGGQNGKYSPIGAQGTVPAPGDSGGASRFFPVFKYQAKAPKKERPVIYKNNCECEEWQSQQKDTTGSTATAETSWSMSTSGNSTMEKCQRDTTSTTSTMTSSTTGSKTSNALAGSTISESTQGAKSEMANGGNHAESAESLNQSEQNTGISARRGGHSTDGVDRATSEKSYTTSKCEKCGEPKLKVQHATVKPLALMEWLVSLIVPPGGVVLDPFAGTGTTLQAATNKGFRPIGIEADTDYIQLIHQRLEGGEQSTRNS